MSALISPCIGLAVVLLAIGLFATAAHADEFNAGASEPNGVLTPEEQARLDALLSQQEREKRSIENDSPSLEECDRRYREWRDTPRPDEDVTFILDCAKKSLAMDPIAWDTYHLSVVLLSRGCWSAEFVAMGKSVVEAPLPKELSPIHFNALGATIGSVGRQQQPGSEVDLLRWASAGFWEEHAPDGLVLRGQDVVDSLRHAAIQGLYALPRKQATKALKQIRKAITEETAEETSNPARVKERLLNAIDMYLADLVLQKKNKLNPNSSVRGYMYQGPGATIYVD